MDITLNPLPLTSDPETASIIKVIGVGGGGGNAVNHMYRQGINDVTFVVCNTDNQALKNSPVPNKIQLGANTTEGLGAGGIPERARQAAEESIDAIQNMLRDNTKMVFVTAGMGGGTGTGASPVVAKAARDLGILTIGIVTIPFAFEGPMKIRQALEGVAALNEHVDAILVINNEKLQDIYPDLTLSTAFAKADDVLANAAKAIAEIITETGYVNIDFADVYSTMKDGNVAIMNTGYAAGENRITRAIEDALNSPLLNTNDVSGASRVLLSLYCSNSAQIRMEEIAQIHAFMKKVGENVQVIWGSAFDDSLGDDVKITLIATGFEIGNIPGMPAKRIKKETEKVVHIEPQQTQSHATTVAAEKVEMTPNTNKEEIEKAMGELYAGISFTAKVEEKVEEIQIPEEPIFSLDDLDDDEKRKSIEDVPTWKRMNR